MEVEIYYKNGDYYKGQWHNNQRHGIGSVYRKDGKEKCGPIYKNDKLDKSLGAYIYYLFVNTDNCWKS